MVPSTIQNLPDITLYPLKSNRQFPNRPATPFDATR
jgi:hypothetical protein